MLEREIYILLDFLKPQSGLCDMEDWREGVAFSSCRDLKDVSCTALHKTRE